MDIVYLDIETRKVPAPAKFPQKLRWQPFLVGVGWFEGSQWFIKLFEGATEEELIPSLRSWLVANGVCEIRYAATREFDEMVLRGRFTNARRAHLVKPAWEPNLNDLPVQWRNVRKFMPEHKKAPRGSWDCASKDVPAYWAAGHKRVVYDHCAEDVKELLAGDKYVS